MTDTDRRNKSQATLSRETAEKLFADCPCPCVVKPGEAAKTPNEVAQAIFVSSVDHSICLNGIGIDTGETVQCPCVEARPMAMAALAGIVSSAHG